VLPKRYWRNVIGVSSFLFSTKNELTPIIFNNLSDLRQKEEALAKVTPLDMPPGRFRPDDELLAFLEGL